MLVPSNRTMKWILLRGEMSATGNGIFAIDLHIKPQLGV
jgi:hypothetical protein